MASYLDTLLFGIYPYIALAVLVVGSIVPLRPRALHLALGLEPAPAPPAAHRGARCCSTSGCSSCSSATWWAC